MTRITKTSLTATAVFLILGLTFSACGYSLVGRGSSLPPGIENIHIPIFENRSTEPDLDTIVTSVVRNEFIRDGRLKVVDTPNADSVLRGVIQSYALRPLTYDENNNVSEYSADLVVTIVHEDANGVKLQKQRVVTTWRYEVDPSITVAESLRLDAIDSAASKAAETIISLVIEAF